MTDIRVNAGAELEAMEAIRSSLEELRPDSRERVLRWAISAYDSSARECENCSKPFLPEDKRQKFCTPQCSNQARQRRFQAKKRATG